MPKFIIHDKTFNTQKEAIDWTRNHLIALEAIGEIRETDHEYDYLHALVKQYPTAQTKIGIGIESFLIRRNFNNNIALNVRRTDGTITDISWRICVTEKPKLVTENLMSAMRMAIKPEIKAFTDKHVPPLHCEICSSSITGTPHVDHITPLKKIAENFISKNKDFPNTFDIEFSKRWQDFHAKHATLRLTHPFCNLQRNRNYL